MAVATLIARMLTGVTIDTADRREEEVSLASFVAAKYLDNGDGDELRRFMSTGAEGLGALDLSCGGIGYTYKALVAGCWAFVPSTSMRVVRMRCSGAACQEIEAASSNLGT